MSQEFDLVIMAPPVVVTQGMNALEALVLMGWVDDPDGCSARSSTQAKLQETQENCLLVMHENQLVGIVTQQDLWRAEGDRPPISSMAADSLAQITVAEIMTQPVPTIRRSQLSNPWILLELFRQHGIHHLPVLEDDGQVVGVLTPDHLLRWLNPVDLFCRIDALEQRIADLEAENLALLEGRKAKQNPQQREREVQLLYGLTQAIYEAEDFEAALQVTLQQICQEANWDCGEVWIPSADKAMLEPGPVYCCCPTFKTVPSKSSRRFLPGEGLAGRVWQSGRGEWVPNLSRMESGRWMASANPDGAACGMASMDQDALRVTCGAQQSIPLRAACGVPIMASDEVVAVLLLFSIQEQEPRHKEFLDLVQSIASQLGRLVQQKRTEVALRHSEATNRAIIQALPDLLIRMDAQGHYQQILSYGSSNTVIPLSADRDDSTDLVFPEELAAQKLNYAQKALRSGELQIFEQQVEIQGQRLDEEVRIIPLNPQEVLILVRDITKQQMALRDRQHAQLALQDSEARYRLLFEKNPHPMWVYDVETLAFLTVNDAAIAKYGYSREEFLGMTIGNIRPAEDLPPLLATIQTSPLSGVEQSGIWRHFLKDGTLINVDITSHEVSFAGRQAKLVLAQDMTQRLEAEEALRRLNQQLEQRIEQRTADLQASEKRYRAVMDGASDAILLSDLQGNLVQGNRKAEELLGYSPIEIAQLHMQDIYPMADRPRAQNLFLTVIQEGRGHLLDVLVLRQDGQSIPVDITSALIDTGSQQLLLGIFRDIRDRKQIEDQLRKTAAHLSTAQRIATMGSWEFDWETQAIVWSEEVFRIFGRDPALGPPSFAELGTLIHPEDRDRHTWALQYSFATGAPHGIEMQIFHGDGTLRHISSRGEIILDAEGKACRLVGTVMDITDRREWEFALQKSEAQYRGIVEDQTDLICRFLPNGQFTFVNAAYCRHLGLDPENYGSYSLWEVVPPENRDLVQRMLASLTLENPTVTYEEQDLLPNDEVRWQIWTDRAIFDPQGEVIEYQSVGHDITAWKLAELALQESEVKLRLFVEYAPAAVAMFDHEMRYLAVSNRWRQDYELGDRPLLGESHYDVLPEIPDHWKDIHQRCLAGAVEIREAEPLVRLDGQVEWIRWEVRPWHRLDGSIGGLVMLTVLITEQRQAQEQLRNLSARLTLAIRSGAIGIWEWDIAADQLIWDDRMYQLYGIPSADFTGTYQAWINGLHPEDRPLVETEIQQTLRGEKEFDTEFRVVWPDGQLRSIKAYALLQRDAQGLPQRMVGINFDVTERKQAEIQLRQTNEQLELFNRELERATRLKDEFLANMSHELRTPLNAILGMSEGLQEQVFGSLNDRQMRAIATIERSGSHLLELINDILDLSKIEAGKLELELDQVLVPNLCSISMTFVRQLAQQKRIRLSTQIADGIAMIQGDDRRLRQVLINLLTNAVKFTPEGGTVALEVCLEQTEPTHTILVPGENASSEPLPDNLQICFRVIDSGIGIAPENMHKLFQPFVQIDSRLNRQHMGTGLGLSLVQRIVELHGGTISVESDLGQGSCFQVRLPYEELSGDYTPREPERTGSMSASNHQVMIIEDSPVAANQIARYLKDQGLTAHIYSRGEGAIEEIIRVQPALVVLDIQLPNLSGWDVLMQLKQHPQGRSIPVVILSVEDERTRGLALGAADYLVKPVTRHQFQSMLSRLQVDNPVAQSAHPTAKELDKAVRAPVILLADDNQANIDSIFDYLTIKGYNLVLARDGQGVIDLTRTENPDLILMDIQMPGMDGLEAIQRLRSEEAFRRIPIIALTALAMAGDRERCLAAGANDYMTKPVRLKQLVDMIHKLVQP